MTSSPRLARIAHLSILALVALGCRHAAPARPAGAGGPAASVAPTFDGLFADGARWRFTVTQEDSAWDGAQDGGASAPTTETSQMSCWVATTRRFPGGRASEVACDDADLRATERIAGVWIQTADGLWHASVMPAADATPALAPDERFLAARPVEAHDEHVDPPSDDGPSGGSGSTHTVSAEGAGWCVEDTWWGGDEGWRRACLDDRGPVAGAAGSAGASTHEIRFERIEP